MSEFLPITDASDPRIADYISVRERDLTGRDGKFIIEGKVTLEVAFMRSRFELESLFLAESRLEPLKGLLKKVPDNVPVYTAPQSLMDDVVGFPIHRGILACGKKPEQPGLTDWLNARHDAKTLVLAIGLSNHDNAGAVFRNAAALGADAILMDEEGCDPLYRKSIRVSAGTALWLPYFHGETAETLFAAIEQAGYELWTMTPDGRANIISTLSRPEKLCLVLGPEGPGLSTDLIARGRAVRIPMANEVDSLNVATSLAIALSHTMS